ncbi:unnamed protein product [Echinostoma caproni]|uniref:SUEL-type lectin domain-containing protein n=1 Tax=Echinostoma caproni TaxID=27848 RepID=A0A183ACR0_9TREM|nr:unnamed protein product [Echinostoma caproni]
MLHCPSGAFVHITDAIVGQTFTTDSPCPHTGHLDNKGDPVAIDPAQRVQCAPTSIVSVVQQLCQGMNTCDIVRKLSRTEANLECQYTAFLRVNYTCFPAYAQQEVVCADSYVELSCASLGSEATLLLLRAQLGSHPLSTDESAPTGKSKPCSNTVDQGTCH